MSNPKDVLLISTLHDPRGVFIDVISQASAVVLEGYKGWVINVTTATDSRVKDALRSLTPLGIYVTEVDPDNPIVSDGVENDHLYSLAKNCSYCKRIRY